MESWYILLLKELAEISKMHSDESHIFFSTFSASGLSHISSPRRSVYESQQASSSSSSNTGYSQPQPKLYSQVHESAESRSQTHGREMKYTIKDPHNKGTTHVSETHVVSNRQMHGAEAEAAMKKLMGSMGPGSDNGFGDIFKGFGLPFY